MPRRYTRWDGGATKRCARCDQDKPLDAYRLLRGKPRSYCIACDKQANAEYRARHHDELLARRRANYPEFQDDEYRHRQRRWTMVP